MALALLSTPATAQTARPECRDAPLQGRALYLRGTFNSWAAAEAQRFTWACQRWELVTRIAGEHRFKIGDEGWSADADWGAPPAATQSAVSPQTATALPRLPLQAKGIEIHRRFDGVYRFSLRMNNQTPELDIESCAPAAPLGETLLFLRGSLNNWAALDEYAFQFSCDAYYLNLKASGRHEFKVADSSWQDSSTIGPAGWGRETAGNFVHHFDGEHTVRLAWAGGRPQLSVGPRTFADPRAAPVTDPVALSLRFDSRDLHHKTPFGAIVPGTEVQFQVSALPGVKAMHLVVERRRLEGNQEVLEYQRLHRLPMRRLRQASPEVAGEEDRQLWSVSHRFDEVAIHGYWFEADIGGQTFVFQNNRDPVPWTREKGSGGPGEISEMPAHAGAVRRFRQTVHAADFRVPDWAPDIVYYYIFPERFRNGDKGNDPQVGRDKYQRHGIEVHKNWLDKPFVPRSGDGSDEVYNNDFFGGDLAGIIDKLGYIRDLGANTIYMTPIFRAASNHKYDHADYRQIDPAFGNNADFHRLTTEAAKHGIRVITDASLNHTGSDSIYFDRYGNFKAANGHDRGAFENEKLRAESPFASWYRLDPSQKDPDKQYHGWVGVTDLPELDKSSPAWRDFAYRAPDSVTRLWLNQGAAGWRMDVAPWVPDDFWREWRAVVKATKPDAITVAETWFDASKYFLGDMFDSTMNYIFRNTVLDYAAGGDAKALYRNIELMREAYPPQAFYALMNLLSSHDQARSLHAMGWKDDVKDPAAIELAKRRFKLAVFFQMMFPGSPAVYYGDEAGVTGGDDPQNRRTYPWADEGGQPDLQMLAEFKRLIALRHQHPVLRRGSIDAPLWLDTHVIVLLRRLGDNWALVATNNALTTQEVELELPIELRGLPLVDAESGRAANSSQTHLRLRLPALSGRLWVSH